MNTRTKHALHTDLYQLTMAAAYFQAGLRHKASFEMFVRSMPRDRGYLLAAGLEQILAYLTDLRFTGEEIDYLRDHPSFRHVDKGFFEYLRQFEFHGEIWALPEGTLFFAAEPLIRVTAPLIEAQIVETYILSMLNFQTMVATKASRVVGAARGRTVVDFGTRRAHGPEAGVWAARASTIGGCAGTSNVHAARTLGISAVGTAAHSFVMAFDTEKEAFETYFSVFPESTVFLIDTYDTLTGARLATAFGPGVRGVRLDSGDLASLATEVRRILDDAGMTDTKIMASSDLNEYRIEELLDQGAPIDSFGVGTEMVTSRDDPALSGVYKLVETEREGRTEYRLKLSRDKATLPGRKQVFRRVEDGRLREDLIGLHDEQPEPGYVPLMEKYMENGRVLSEPPALEQIRQRALEGIEALDPGVRKTRSPEPYPVHPSPKLRALFDRVRKTFEDRGPKEGS